MWKVDKSLLEGESVEIFRAAIKSKYTLDPYERRLVGFLKYAGMDCDSFVKLAKSDKSEAEKVIIRYILHEKSRVDSKQISPSTIYGKIKPVRLLLEMNDVVLNWKKLKKILPRERRYALDRIPTKEEARKVVNAADLRGKALILAFISSGIREGAVETLKVGHFSAIKKKDGLFAGRLVVYAGDPDQYATFITKECCEAIEDYLQYRRSNGEDITDESPLFRDRFDPSSSIYYWHNRGRPDSPKPMTPSAIRHYYDRLFRTLGLRNGRKRRHEFSVHSLRKYFKTHAEQAMKSINVEILMGHSIGLADSYYKPREDELLEDYLNAVPSLTVSEEEKLKKQLVEQEVNFEERIQALDEKLNSILSSTLSKPQEHRQFPR